MPLLTPTTVLQIALLLSAIPAQYLISRWSGATVTQRYHATTRLRGMWKEWKASYLNSTAWQEWAHLQAAKVRSLVGLGDEEPSPEDSASPEMWMFDNEHGYFGASRAARSPRPPFVFLRVGAVVRERNGHMVGVVVGWDAERRAPEEWVNRVYPNQEEIKAEKTPHYKVLFSGPGASSVLVAYLPQTQLVRVTGVDLEIPTLEQYFTHFNGRQFVMRSWLRERYPDDEEAEEAEDEDENENENEEWPH